MATYNYHIPFTSLRANKECHIYIYGAPTGAERKVLKGAPSPITIEEDDSSDYFVPVRTQSGYIRFVDDGTLDDWRDIIPATYGERPVTVLYGGAVVWRGYLQPTEVVSSVYDGVTVRELAVQSRLAVLEHTGFTLRTKEMVSLAEVLDVIFNGFVFSYTQFVFRVDQNVTDWLMYRVDPLHFIKKSDDGASAEDKYTLREALEQLCTISGWTCREWREYFIFDWHSSHNDSYDRTVSYTLSELQTIAGGTAYYPTEAVFPDTVDVDTVNLFADTDSEVSDVRPLNTVTINSDYDSNDDALFTLMSEPLQKQLALTVQSDPTNNYTLVDPNSTSYSKWTGYPNMILSPTTDHDYFIRRYCGADQSTGSFFLSRLRLVEYYQNGSDKSPETHTTLYFIKSASQQSDTTNCMLRFRTAQKHVFRGGWIDIKFGWYINATKKDDYNDYIIVRMAMTENDVENPRSASDTVWNNVPALTWQSAVVGRAIYVNDGTAAVPATRMPFSSTPREGYLFVEIAMPTTSSGDYHDLTDIEITYHEGWNTYDTHRYFQTIDVLADDDVTNHTETVENSIAGDDFSIDVDYGTRERDEYPKWSYGLLLKKDGSYVQSVTYEGAASGSPVYHLAKRIADLHRATIAEYTIPLRMETIAVQEISPFTPITVKGTKAKPIALAWDWQQDEITVKAWEEPTGR